MDYVKNIPVSDIKVKRRELEEVIKKAEKDIAHLDYVLQNFSEQTPSPFLVAKPVVKDAKTIIIQIIKESSPAVLRTNVIYDKLKEVGCKVTEATFLAYMSQIVKDISNTHVERVQQGHYRYVL